MYLFVAKKEIENLKTVKGDLVYVIGVDLLKENLVLFVYEEGREEEYISEIASSFAVAEVPGHIEFSEIYRETFDKTGLLTKFVGVLLILVLFYGVGSFVKMKYEQRKQMEAMKAQQIAQAQNPFTPEEQRRAEKIVFFECMKKADSIFKEYANKDYMRVRAVEFRFTKEPAKVACLITVSEEYLYPEVGTVKSGEIYTKVRSEKVEVDRKMLESYPSFVSLGQNEDREACVKALLRTGFDVIKRDKDKVEMKWERTLDNKMLGVKIPLFLKELEEVCGGNLWFDFLVIRSENKGEKGYEVSVSGSVLLYLSNST